MMNDLVCVRGVCTSVCFGARTRKFHEAEALKSGRALANFVVMWGHGEGCLALWLGASIKGLRTVALPLLL